MVLTHWYRWLSCQPVPDINGFEFKTGHTYSIYSKQSISPHLVYRGSWSFCEKLFNILSLSSNSRTYFNLITKRFHWIEHWIQDIDCIEPAEIRLPAELSLSSSFTSGSFTWQTFINTDLIITCAHHRWRILELLAFFCRYSSETAFHIFSHVSSS